MRTRSSRLAWALAVVGLVALVAGVVLLVVNRRAGVTGAAFAYTPILVADVAALAVLGVGLLVALRRPSSPIGWLMLALVLAADVQGVGVQYAAYGLLAHPGAVPGAVAVAVAVNGAWVLAILALLLMTFLFPTGRLPSPRFAPFLAVTVASLGALYIVNLFTDLSSPFAHIRNPIAVHPGPVLGPLIAIPIIIGAPLGLLAACVSIAVRFRRANTLEREQIKWFVFAASVLPVLIAIHLVAETLFPGALDTVEAVFSGAVALFPVAIGIAILRYRLYEIDRIISRTIVYAVLSVVLAAVYVGVVLAGQALFSSFAGGSGLAIAVSTLVVAALFLPVRSRIQGAVDRRFYRRRYDAQRTLDAFGARLREQVDLDALGSELCGVVSRTVQPSHVAVWLRGGDGA